MVGALDLPMSPDETEPELPFDQGQPPQEDQFRGMLMDRLATLSREEKQLLDSAITPEVAGVLSKVLPELGDIISMVASSSEASEGGALSGVVDEEMEEEREYR